jgi:type II secretory pathway component PulC
MPQTITKTYEGRLLGGIFSNCEYTQRAIDAFKGLSMSETNIQIVQLSSMLDKDPYTDYLVRLGFVRSQARFYDKALQEGRILVALYQVTDPNPIIKIFDQYKAKYRLLR